MPNLKPDSPALHHKLHDSGKSQSPPEEQRFLSRLTTFYSDQAGVGPLRWTSCRSDMPLPTHALTIRETGSRHEPFAAPPSAKAPQRTNSPFSPRLIDSFLAAPPQGNSACSATIVAVPNETPVIDTIHPVWTIPETPPVTPCPPGLEAGNKGYDWLLTIQQTPVLHCGSRDLTT